MSCIVYSIYDVYNLSTIYCNFRYVTMPRDDRRRQMVQRRRNNYLQLFYREILRNFTKPRIPRIKNIYIFVFPEKKQPYIQCHHCLLENTMELFLIVKKKIREKYFPYVYYSNCCNIMYSSMTSPNIDILNCTPT